MPWVRVNPALVKFAYKEAELAGFPTSRMGRSLDVSQSNAFAWLGTAYPSSPAVGHGLSGVRRRDGERRFWQSEPAPRSRRRGP